MDELGSFDYRDGTYLGYHVALWMPALVLSIPVHLHKLLENGSLTSDALDGEAGRIVKVAVYHQLPSVG